MKEKKKKRRKEKKCSKLTCHGGCTAKVNDEGPDSRIDRKAERQKKKKKKRKKRPHTQKKDTINRHD